jgi:hypothetical protein
MNSRLVHQQLEPLIAKTVDSNVGDIETAAACAMLHSFYTEIEKMLKLIAREWDARIPSSDAWHKELLNQMVVPTNTRPAVITSGLVEILSEFIALSASVSGSVHCPNALGQACSPRREGRPDVRPDAAGTRNLSDVPSISKQTLVGNASVSTQFEFKSTLGYVCISMRRKGGFMAPRHGLEPYRKPERPPEGTAA